MTVLDFASKAVIRYSTAPRSGAASGPLGGRGRRGSRSPLGPAPPGRPGRAVPGADSSRSLPSLLSGSPRTATLSPTRAPLKSAVKRCPTKLSGGTLNTIVSPPSTSRAVTARSWSATRITSNSIQSPAAPGPRPKRSSQPLCGWAAAGAAIASATAVVVAITLLGNHLMITAPCPTRRIKRRAQLQYYRPPERGSATRTPRTAR